MRTVLRAYEALIAALPVLAGVTILSVFALIVVDVSMRAIGFNPPLFTTAYVEYALLYFALFAAPWLVRRKAHVFIGAVAERLPVRYWRTIEKGVYFVCIVSTLAFAYLSLILLLEALESGTMDERGVYIAQWLLYAPMPVSFLLVAVEFTRFLLGADSLYSRGEPQDTI